MVRIDPIYGIIFSMDQQPSPATSGIPAQSDPRAEDARRNKDLAALSYAWVLSAFILVYRRDSAFVRFHARQGVVLFALSIAVWLLPTMAARLSWLVLLAACATGFASAAQGQWRELPLIYAVSRGDPRLLVSSVRRAMQAAFTALRRRRSNRAGKEDAAKAQSAQQPPPISTV